MRGGQLGLLLWKNYVVRKRQPGILALVFLWPIVVFMILFTLRDNIDLEYTPTCQFPARLMPQDGLLPFVQSYICSVGNPCDPLEDYEEVPSYKNASLGPLLVELQPMLRNNTVLSAIKTLPKSIQLLKSMAEILTRPEIKALFDRGIRLGDLFINHDQIKDYLRAQLPMAREGLIDGIFNSSIRLYYLIDTFGSSNIDGVICSPESLKKYLILPEEEDYAEISRILCNIDSATIPDILQNLSSHLDFSGLLAMVDRVMAKFREYDFFLDLRKAAETILNLETVKKYVPAYLKVQQWIPKIIMVFKNVTFKEIDLTFIDNAIEVLDPIFADEKDWPYARRGFLKINKLLGMVKTFLVNRGEPPKQDFFSVMERMKGNIENLTAEDIKNDNITQMLDVSYTILQEGILLTNKLLDRHRSEMELAAEVFDNLKRFFPKNIVNFLTYFMSVADNVVMLTHHIAVLHDDMQHKMYEAAINNREVVQQILTFDPKIYRTVVNSFYRLDFVEKLVEELYFTKASELICQKDIMYEIFNNFEDPSIEYEKMNAVFCDKAGKKFITDVYDSFNTVKFSEIVTDTLQTLVMIALRQPIKIEKANLTALVRSAKKFVTYLESPKQIDPDWSDFNVSEDWTNTFKETAIKGRMDILGIHLSIAKMLGSRSISYMTIKPDLENMDILAATILQDLRSNPTSWISEVRRHQFQLIEAIYLTAADREKTLKILEYSNFTASYCANSNPPNLLNFPKSSNESLLRALVCRLEQAVEINLDLNITNAKFAQEIALGRRKDFNWTGFNEKTMQIYEYIDSLVHQEDQYYDLRRLEPLRENFTKSWTKDITVRDAWEISVGLLCRICSLMEKPLFNIQAKKEWKYAYALAWASSVVFDSVERVVDQIRKNDNVAKLADILHSLPQTEILLETFLRNLSPVVLDVIDIVTMKIPVHLIPALDEYKDREPDWPCIKKESVGEALELRNGTRAVIREIERIACNPGLFIKEWKEQPILLIVKKIFEDDNTVQLPPFNWTYGYGKFRRLVNKVQVLVDDTKEVVLQENPKMKAYMKALAAEAENMIDDRMPALIDESHNILYQVDLEVDKAIDAFRSNLSANEVWNPKVSETNRILVMTKFLSHLVHSGANLIKDILRDDSGKIGMMALMGFGSKSPISIFHDKLPFVIATIVNGLSSPTTNYQILEAIKEHKRVTCTDIFDWFDDFKIHLGPQEYKILKNFTCDLDPEDFNAYADFYSVETMTWRKPANQYRSYVMSVLGDIYDLARLIQGTMKKDILIIPPFSKESARSILINLRNALEIRPRNIPINQADRSPQETLLLQVIFETLSEGLLYVTEALRTVKVHNSELYLWQLAQQGDVQQVLKVVETHPEETIALIATLSTINETTASFVDFKDLRKIMCTLHFHSDYWSAPSRMHFLKELCSFDPYQLLRTITSDEVFRVVVGDAKSLPKQTPLSLSLTNLVDQLLNLTSMYPNLEFRSTVFNATTLKRLSNETWTLIKRAEDSWIHEYLVYVKTSDRQRNQKTLTLELIRILQLIDVATDVLSGGDTWQKLRVIYDSSKVKPFLALVEDLPNLVLTAVDTFVTSERLTDFLEKLYDGKVHPCDIDRYLIPPNFVKKKNILTSITNFCEKILMNTERLSQLDALPFEENLVPRNVKKDVALIESMNETYILNKVHHLQTTIVHALTEGFQRPKIPAWWVSFEEGSYKDFLIQYQKKDTRAVAHSVVKKVSGLLKYIFSKSLADPNDCSWCSTLTVEIINSQLSRHQLYTKLLCQMNRLNASQIHEILIRDFYWNKTITMIKDYKYLNTKKTLNDFISALEATFHHIADIIVDFQNDAHREEVTQCFYKFVGGPKYSRPGFYASFLLGSLDILQRNIHLIDTASTHEDILRLTRLAEKYVPIWKPLQGIVKEKDRDTIEKLLPNATINVNAIFNDISKSLCKTADECKNSTILYNMLSSKKAGKVLRYDPKILKHLSVMNISNYLANSLDWDLIERVQHSWRQEAAWDITWLKELLFHLSVVLGEGGNLLDVASKIDFEDVTNVLGVPDVVDGVVNLLKDKTVDKLFNGMKEMLEDIEPLIEAPEVVRDLYSMIVALENMEIFKNLGLLDMKYVVSDMFDNWDFVRNYLVDKINISSDVALTLSQAKIDMISVFMKERKAISLKDTICSPKKLGEMLNFEQGHVTAEEVSPLLCQLNDSQTQNITITLMKNLNFDYVFKTLMSANVKSILANANLTEAEGQEVLESLGVASELMPFFKEKLSSGMGSSNVEENESEEPMSSSKFLQDSSEMLCGRPLVSDNGEFYKILASIEDNSKAYDQKELDSLPTDFCRETYKSMVAMTGGKIIWTYVKPLLRGKILYAPNTAIIDKVMDLANDTFLQMENFGMLLDSFERTLTSLANLSEMGDSLKDLQEIMASDVMKIAVKSFGDGSGDFDGSNLSEMNLSELAWKLKKSKKLITMVGMLNDLMDCILVDRVRGFASEEELEQEARNLTDTNEFLSAVVFLEGSDRIKRSIDDQLPENVTYKIRMDVDYVPSTTRLKNQFWIPGPESSFIEDLRYLRGFIQLQDAVDRAIIRVKSQRDQNWMTVTQQMPYPCWKRAPFQSTLYESQGVQVCFFFALMMCVGSAVRYIVWERESQNAMVMSVMGLKPWRNTFAWSITSFVELSIVMFSIAMILLPGQILPRSDPFLIGFLMIDYIFSIVTFCYMISTLFSSASLAAITTVVMFLLTYMPYVIVIAMEAVFGLGYKLLICLSMSTSFCYGCLYAVRKEVQGMGLQWEHMWEESSPGDTMSLGLVLVMLAFDGCLYATIGYFITRYMNSGRGFHGLRSRSLWWSNTRSLYGRPSYLAFVNNLYFTNDVLHPSATYQEDESDISNLTVTEKQIGVRFEGIRKVYHTERGDIVAVDDFTLKLCEGEVTSLLGRNGAGKTTIIKMLTGMLAPTSGEICLNGEEGCKPDIGVCPQDNVLIGTLTPREHMLFYWKLKRTTDTLEMQRNVNEMLASLELGRQEHEPVSRLSGGTRRRLCVALAFLGSPKLVILDEPGAGVDPAARRRIWRLIDQHRIGRTVILSTHHLDEADMLSDTVVIMHKGKILCTGSPLSLKLTHGRGYRLNISYSADQETRNDTVDRKSLEALRTVIEDVIPNAVINEVSGNEVVVTLPFQGKHGGNNDIAQAAKTLEDNQKILGISHFSLECDTLERVFLDLCSRADSGSSIVRASQDSVATMDHIGLSIPNDDIDLIDMEPTPRPTYWRQAKALLKKRLWHFYRDWRSPLAALALPTLFVAVAMGFSLIRPPSQDEPPLNLTPKLYDTHPTYFYSVDGGEDQFLQRVSMQLHDRFGDDYAGAWQTLPNDTGVCECTDGQQVCHDLSKAVEGLLQTLPGRPTLDWVVSTHQEYIEKRYGGWSLSHYKDNPLFVVWYNNKGHHSMPAYLNALNEAILRAQGVHGHLTTLNHPLKLSSEQLNRTSLLQHVADVGVALVLLVAFSLVGAQGARELVRERLSEEKRILYLAGVHPVTYWTVALVWDFFVFGLSILLAVIVFEIFGLSAYTTKDNLAGVCLLLFLFAWAAIPFSHLCEKIFDDSSLSNMVLFCVNTFIGVISLATILVLDIVGKTKASEDARDILHHILLIFPQYALGDALVQISRNDITAELLAKFSMDTYQSPLGWDLLGLHFVFLTVVGAILFFLNLIIECRLLPEFTRQSIAYEVIQEDDDVARERMRVEGGHAGDDVLRMIKLRKEYKSVYGTNVAVQNLSLGVQSGKCFGLLGVNGAGKSTTFKMLTTEVIPTAGRIMLKDKEVGRGPLCNGEIGYCPQSDALDSFLTPHQCLTIHGEVCGLNNVPRAVEITLKRLDLLKYAHQRVSSLSGGNKRKLCAALSMMAPVSIVLMDEPTSGMDPATKDLVSRCVQRVTKNQTCVILTSHSVAECENLCTRVGILAKAGLRCIGTSQHLKHKFGEGYVAFLRFSQPVTPADLRKTISKYLPQAVISSRQATAARLLVPRSQDMALSTSFNMVKLLAAELKATDFTLTQSSLDQVLVNFSEELEDEIIDPVRYGQGSRNSNSNNYTNADAIHMETF